MNRRIYPTRSNWQQKVADVGLTFHTIDGSPYWDESVAYEFTLAQIEILEQTAQELHDLYLKAAETVIERGWWDRLEIPSAAILPVIASWEREDFHLYGRFDLAWDGTGSPKLLEYNADTPTALVESSVAQWYWLQEMVPEADQFNSLHERLIAAWATHPASEIHFACMAESEEDAMTTAYLSETAQQAGKRIFILPMDQIGWNAGTRQFVDARDRAIEALFKLYPWEWMWTDSFGQHLAGRSGQFIEPMWKMLLSNKGMLPILWELFPDHPNLLAAFDSPGYLKGNYVQKPKLSREGANVTIVENGSIVQQQGGAYADSGTIYQAIAPLPTFSGQTPILGVWMVHGEPAGMGLREEAGRITSNLSRFVPHLIGGA